ncbi:bola-like protein [Astrocystis sublimbata]|nr:bola-like protein [Astrocystis sublimbata]
MVGFQWRRAAVSALRQRSAAAAAARSNPTNSLPLRMQSRSYLTAKNARSSSGPSSSSPRSTMRYSTAATTPPTKPDHMRPAESDIWDKLTAEFAPTALLVQDISGGCGSMYGIEIASEKFRGVNMLKQQRMVNAVLSEELKGWHGLQLKTRLP